MKVFYKPRPEASEETNPADTLTLKFQPPELREKFCQAPQTMVFCYSRTAKLIQEDNKNKDQELGKHKTH